MVSRLNLIAHQAGLGRAELADLVVSALNWVLFVDSMQLVAAAKFEVASDGRLAVTQIE